MISLFSGISTTVVKNISIQEGIERIKSGASINIIEQIRKSTDKSEIDKLKKQLFSVTWAGSFKYRNAQSLIKSSGLACFDFDHLNEPEFLKKYIFETYEHIFAAWISPSGNGVKALVRIPEVANDIEYKKYYNAILNKIDIASTDKSTKDISRLAFESYDPLILVRKWEDTKVWKLQIETETINVNSYKVIENNNVAIERIYKNVSDTIRAAADGEKYYTLLKMGRLLGGYVASNTIEKSDAICLLETEIQNRNIKSFKNAQKAIENSIEYGKRDPIYLDLQVKTTAEKTQEIITDLYDINVEQFPIDIFPPIYETLIKNLDLKLNFPKDFTAFSILWVYSTIMGKKWAVQVKEGYIAYPVLWFAIVGEPGVSKSHPIKLIKAPIDKVDSETYEIYKKETADYNLIENNKDPKPKWKKHQITDFTFEAIEKILTASPNGVGLYVDEMSIWIDNVNRYSSGNTLSQWLALYDSGRIIIDRKTMEPVMIDKACIPIIGTIQPDVLLDYFNKYSGNGFFDRFLFAFPNTTVRPLNNENGYINELLDHNFVIDQLIRAIPTLKEDVVMTFENWNDYNEIDLWLIAKYNDSKTNQRLKGYLPKLRTSIPRLALIIEFINYVKANGTTPKSISTSSMKKTFKLIMYLFNHAEKVLVNFNKTQDIHRLLNSNSTKSRQDQCFILKNAGFSIKDIAMIMNLSESTVKNNIERQKKQNTK